MSFTSSLAAARMQELLDSDLERFFLLSFPCCDLFDLLRLITGRVVEGGLRLSRRLLCLRSLNDDVSPSLCARSCLLRVGDLGRRRTLFSVKLLPCSVDDVDGLLFA